jgi:hypothetical protein
MGITSLSAGAIQPTKPRTAQFTQVNTTPSTYYTALNVTGRGVVSRILMNYFDGGAYISSFYQYIRITIDSGTPVVINVNLTSTGFGNLRGLGLQYVSGGNSVGPQPAQIIFYDSTTYFYQSCLIEVMQSANIYATSALNCVIDYSIV